MVLAKKLFCINSIIRKRQFPSLGDSCTDTKYCMCTHGVSASITTVSGLLLPGYLVSQDAYGKNLDLYAERSRFQNKISAGLGMRTFNPGLTFTQLRICMMSVKCKPKMWFTTEGILAKMTLIDLPY